MAERIVTHDGSSHMDDLLSVCLVLARNEDVVDVERRDPTAAELADSGVWVLDVGFQHKPKRKNFDHHQFPAGTRHCCFSLLTEHFGLVKDLGKVGWYKALVAMDALGPTVAAHELSCPIGTLGALHGPVQRWLLQEFSRVRRLSRDHELLGILRRIGIFVIETASLRRDRLALIRDKAEWIEVAGLPCLLFLEEVPEPGSFIDAYQEECGRWAAAVVTRNNRNQGWAMRRVDDEGPVDFRRVAKDPAIRFAHASGFMAATNDYLPREEIARLLALALVEVSD